MRLAVIADTHGNLIALETVLADIAREKPDLVVNLGDCVSGPLWPRETLERLADLKAQTVRGNHDRQVSTLAPHATGASDRYAHEQLNEMHLDRLKALPLSLQVTPDILAFHARPHRDDLYLLDEVTDSRLTRARLGDIEERLDGAAARLILCGHSHRPDAVRLRNGSLIVNPGASAARPMTIPRLRLMSPKPERLMPAMPLSRCAQTAMSTSCSRPSTTRMSLQRNGRRRTEGRNGLTPCARA